MAWQDTQPGCQGKQVEFRGVTVSTPHANCPWCAPDAVTEYVSSESDANGKNTGRTFHRCHRCGAYFDNNGKGVSPSECTYQGREI